MKKKFINTEQIEGYVFSIGSGFNQLSERVAGENSKHPGTKYIQGDLDIAVDEDGLNVITIHYTYVTEKWNNGSINTTYGFLKEIIEHPEKHWINGGKENAFKVQCSGVSIGVNDFIAADGSKIAALRNENGFCTIVREFNPVGEKNKFKTDMLITKVVRVEADPERNIKEDYATVHGCIFGYGQQIPTLIPVTFVVRNAAGIDYFEDLEATQNHPVFTNLWGYINCMTIKTEKREESAFGEAAVQYYEKKVREYLITGTARIPYEFNNEEVLTVAEVNEMMQNRQIKLAEIEERAKKKKTEELNQNNFASIPDGDFRF